MDNRRNYRIYISIIVIILLIVFIGIAAIFNFYFKEDKQFSALKTEAVYSSFGYPGSARDGINVIEIDENGRVLYEFDGQNFANYYGITHILVCQYIDYDNELVYYYPENNFIIRLIYEETPHEQLEQLKLLNDWNQEIDLSKCISKKIGAYKKINNELEIVSIFDNLNLDIDEQYKKIILCYTDKNGLKLYAVKIAKDEQNYKIFAFMKKNDDFTDYDIIEITGWYYIDVIKEFKNKHNWMYQ